MLPQNEIIDFIKGGVHHAKPHKSALYLTEDGDGNQVSVRDIQQGSVGDCGFCAVMAEIAIRDPSFITDDLIQSEDANTDKVNLFNDQNDKPILSNSFPTGYTLHPVEVDHTFPKNSVNQYNHSDIIKGTKEVWPQVLEKAYANDIGGYAALNQGVADSDTMQTLTGNIAQYEHTSALNLDEFNTLINTPGEIMTFSTDSGAGQPYHLVGNHSYAFAGTVQQGGETAVALLNPWGKHQPDLVPFSQLASALPNFSYGKI